MKAALDYGRLGWSVVPIEPRGTRPLIRWQVYQHRRPDATEVAEWFRRRSDANIAVVIGVVSGLVVLDLDPRHGAKASVEELERKSVKGRSGWASLGTAKPCRVRQMRILGSGRDGSGGG